MKKIIFILICIVNLSLLKAQDYNFKQYGQKQGLINTNVKCIFQDSYGYIWFATQGGGISKFDGKTFMRFTEAEGLPMDNTNVVFEDKERNIWIGSDGKGLCKFLGETFFADV